MFRTYKFFRQPDQMDCGPTCLKIIAAYYGRNVDLQRIRDYSNVSREGVSMYSLATAAEKLGFYSRGVTISFKNLKEVKMPCILHWDQNHFVVLYKCDGKNFVIADPAASIIKYSQEEVLEHWSQNRETGIVLLLDTTPDFRNLDEDENRSSFNFLFLYLLKYKKLLLQLAIGFLIGSILQVMLPFLTQSIVDLGIPTQDLGFINLVLLAQFSLLIGRTGVDFLRSWILLHISTRLNIFVLTDFLSKLMKLPISFFDTKKTGDIMQRIDDQRRIEIFLTGQTLSVGFSLFTLFFFSIVLAFYNLSVFAVFVIGSTLYTLWIFAFLGKRRQLDHKRFDISSKTQSYTIQMVQGMQEIKLSGTEKKKRWEWEDLQAKLFRFNVKSLSLGQYQQAGGLFFNEGKNLIIIYLVAKSVISGEMTLGAMIAIQYIIGLLNSPIEQFQGFIQSYQDAKLSLERLNELFTLEDEEQPDKNYITELPDNCSIQFKDVTFNYPGNDPVLKNINLSVPNGKTTAIVGMSGSGKSTLIKLLLGFYKAQRGLIACGKIPIDRFNPNFWRKQCGVVMQDSFIFSDTIAANITLSEKKIDLLLLEKAIHMACLEDFISSLPLGLETMIGSEGNGISQGQRQRILIARAIYKQPQIILLDEATNSLDANNERMIVENLNEFFISRTVIIVAHRLSTVKNADNIVVLDNGRVIEQGTHSELTQLRGKYYELVLNQLELEN